MTELTLEADPTTIAGYAPLKVGTICRTATDETSLVARAFYHNGLVTHPMVVSSPDYPLKSWYPGAPVVYVNPVPSRMAQHFCNDKQTMIFFRSCDWRLVDYCRAKGIRTILWTTYEYAPRELPANPNVIICPTAFDQDLLSKEYPDVDVVFLPFPVDPTPYPKRERAKCFLHVVTDIDGLAQSGTFQLIEAMEHVESDLHLRIQLAASKQLETLTRHYKNKPDLINDPRIQLVVGDPSYDLVWPEDVLILPLTYGSFNYTALEAYAAGMMVMVPELYSFISDNPFGGIPFEPTIPVQSYRGHRFSPRHRPFEEARITCQEIAAVMDEWYDRDISDISETGIQWGENNDWDAHRSSYIPVIRG